MTSSDTLIALYAQVIEDRLLGDNTPTDQERAALREVVEKTLRIADSLHLLVGAREEPAPTPGDVDDAAQLLARGSPRYDDIPRGLGWRAVLHPVNLRHAYRACMAEAASQPERDRYSAAYALLSRHLTLAVRRAAPTVATQGATLSSTTSQNDGGGSVGRRVGTSPTDSTAASPGR